jgi:large conductance mechanosensitive channel
MGVLGDFKKFLLRGNVVDLAVAVVVGTAFTTLVTALVKDLLTPIIGLVAGKHDFSTLAFTINSSRFAYGDFINKAIAFASVATVVFFFVVVPINTLLDRRRSEPPTDETVRDCPECLSEVPVAARRCAFCTAEIGPA